MEDEIIFDEDSFEYEVYQVLDPVIKTFLSVYFGERLLHLEPESYSEIETAIKKNIYFHNGDPVTAASNYLLGRVIAFGHLDAFDSIMR